MKYLELSKRNFKSTRGTIALVFLSLITALWILGFLLLDGLSEILLEELKMKETSVSNQQNYSEQPQESNFSTKICTPKSKCPYNSGYRESCGEQANISPFLPKLEEEKFVSSLLSFFHGKRVALIGDSLTRQWYEMLSCRLGMDIRFFSLDQPLPSRLLEAQKAGVQIAPLHVPPQYMVENNKVAHGYATSSVSLDTDTPVDCQTLESTLEFYHQDTLPKNGGLLDFIADRADVVVTNVGLHYKIDECDDCPQYKEDLEKVFQTCSTINLSGRAKCMFLETTPQHFQFEGDPNSSGYFTVTSEDGTEKTRKKQCGPIDYKESPSHKANMMADGLSKKYQVPIVHVESILRDAWRWHVHLNSEGFTDCTHFCQDNEVWDIFHSALIAAK